jgi:hypothetical protein
MWSNGVTEGQIEGPAATHAVPPTGAAAAIALLVYVAA